jgi:putative tricarboxylic transport membrane protein
MIDIIFAALVGTVSGLVVGLIPGLGAASIILILLPVLYHIPLEQVIIFYICMIGSTQYYGSVSAIVFSVIGEVTSAPALRNGHELFRRGQGHQILYATATGSLIASIIGMIALVAVTYNAESIIPFLKIEVRVVLFLFIIGTLIFFTPNRKLSLIMALLGLIIGNIGFNPITMTRFLVPDYSLFDAGVPFSPLLIGFAVIPLLISHCVGNHAARVPDISFVSRSDYKFTHYFSAIRGAIVGCLSGIIPGVSYTVSSNLAENFEKKFCKKINEDERLFRLCVAAESANNSGAITVLIPFLLFGLAIIPSEALILHIAERKGFFGVEGVRYIIDNLGWIVVIMGFANLINWLLSGYWYQCIIKIYQAISAYVYYVALIICILTVVGIAWYNNQLAVSVITLVLSAVVGMLIKSYESRLVLIFSFFLADKLWEDLIRLSLKYF